MDNTAFRDFEIIVRSKDALIIFSHNGLTVSQVKNC